VSGVTFAIDLTQRTRLLDGVSLVLPALESTGERRDRRVAERLQSLGGEQRAHPTATIENDGRGAIGKCGRGAQLEKPAWQMQGARDALGAILIPLTHVDERRAPRGLIRGDGRRRVFRKRVSETSQPLF
jgi:hypothetical protein